MEIKFFKPKNSLLQNYIGGFYVLIRQPQDKPVMYVAFPGVGYFVTINENSNKTVCGEYIKFVHSSKKMPISDFIHNFDRPHFFGYEGATNELNICFKPLGINAFLEKKLSSYSWDFSTPFYPFQDYQQHLSEIAATEQIETKIELIEKYWLSKLKGFEHPFLETVVEELINESGKAKTVTEIAAEHRVSRTTLHKQFEEHLCTTPAQFRKVLRFRKALNKGSVKTTIKSLTDISYLVNYFDQSHMIKDFKALTNQSPKQFFSKITPFADGKINWMFV